MLNDKKPEAVNGSKDMKGKDYELYIYGYRYIYRVVMMKGLSARKACLAWDCGGKDLPEGSLKRYIPASRRRVHVLTPRQSPHHSTRGRNAARVPTAFPYNIVSFS